MTEAEFDELKTRSAKFLQTSLRYTEYGDIAGHTTLRADADLLLLRGFDAEAGCIIWNWAAYDSRLLLAEIGNGAGVVPFVPREWVRHFEKQGFFIRAVWNDYFCRDLSAFAWDGTAESLGAEDCAEISAVTRACARESRGFTGQTSGWVEDWLAGGPDARVLGIRRDGVLAGVVFVTLYAREGAGSPILWMREIAVRPEAQGMGIGRKLMEQALGYGKTRGARRAFLAADEQNERALRLYRSLGFENGKDEPQIDMERE